MISFSLFCSDNFYKFDIIFIGFILVQSKKILKREMTVYGLAMQSVMIYSAQ